MRASSSVAVAVEGLDVADKDAAIIEQVGEAVDAIWPPIAMLVSGLHIREQMAFGIESLRDTVHVIQHPVNVVVAIGMHWS